MLANANCLLGFFFFPFILQKSVAEITPIKSSAWFEFSHLCRFYKANIGKLVHFSFEKGPCYYAEWLQQGALAYADLKKRQMSLLWHLWLFKLNNLTVFTPMTKDAAGGWSIWRTVGTTGVSFLSPAFKAWFCNCLQFISAIVKWTLPG